MEKQPKSNDDICPPLCLLFLICYKLFKPVCLLVSMCVCLPVVCRPVCLYLLLHNNFGISWVMTGSEPECNQHITEIFSSCLTCFPGKKEENFKNIRIKIITINMIQRNATLLTFFFEVSSVSTFSLHYPLTRTWWAWSPWTWAWTWSAPWAQPSTRLSASWNSTSGRSTQLYE